MSLIRIRNLIGGELVDPVSGRWLEDINPANGEAHASVPDSDERDLEQAIDAAEKARESWAATPTEERARVLRRISDAILADSGRLALAETADTGKPLGISSRIDIPRSARNFAFFADAITQFSTECHAEGRERLNYTLREPLGIVGCISPWNLPLYLLSWKVAPALAAGNCVVAKPSEVTPLTAFLLSEICRDQGLPPGVLNIVHGQGGKVGQAMSGHPGIRAISFTGSTATGARISQAAAAGFKKLSLEMGGKNASVVFADCDFDLALRTVVRAAFTNQGEVCLCGSRILVERPIYDRFRAALVGRVRDLKVGDPLEATTDQGAIVSKAHFEKIVSCLELALAEGGRFATGGRPARVPGRCERGWFIEPTVVEGLGNECRTNQEEVFGPLAALIPFEGDEEALRLANSSRYGLACSVFTRDLERAHRFSARVQTGIVWVNCWMERDLRTPFGGVKESGLGREGGWDALRFFTEPKNICIGLRPG